MKNIRKDTPSEFYRMRRPEYFSDSETIYDIALPKEHLAFELANITTNQKHDEFETLCRRLVEKLIIPNLIPQVGPHRWRRWENRYRNISCINSDIR